MRTLVVCLVLLMSVSAFAQVRVRENIKQQSISAKTPTKPGKREASPDSRKANVNQAETNKKSDKGL